MELLLKSEQIGDAERRLLLEIMFAGVNHNLMHQVHSMLPVLPVLVPDDKYRSLCLALLLIGLSEPLKAGRILAHIELPEAKVLGQFFPVF